MFLKSLKITSDGGAVIRDIKFRLGLNLIVDETPIVTGKETGNNVGKTTVLKLVAFCLGGSGKEIYSDTENKRSEYKLVKDFLVNNNICITLVLKDNLALEESREIRIERNFLSRKKRIQKINGESKTDDEFDETLTNILFPGHYGKKPTFPQIIAHNIRYGDQSINNTLKNLNEYTRDDEYETLYLFLLGCDFIHGDVKQGLRSQIGIEEKFKARLEAEQTKSAYEASLALLESEIEELELRRASLNLNPDFEVQLNKLNSIKYQINLTSAEISRIEMRRELILEAQREMQSGESSVDLQQLRQLYEQATSLVKGIQKTFEELHGFHNAMVKSRMDFIAKDLPALNSELEGKRKRLRQLLGEQTRSNAAVTQTDSFEAIESLVTELNAKHQKKGEYENILKQLNAVTAKLNELNKNLAAIDDSLFSDDFALQVQEQLNKFNRHFSAVSHELYGEKYALKFDIKTVKGRRLYEFTPFDTNISSGKKQGEISCFDIAYTLFADEENILCMHFLLNDKKELMHDNQLLRISNFVADKGIQFVASILKDKLPEELKKDEYMVIKLSQAAKLFRIE